ncbi:MAG: O-antigen ligase family protein, partial [Deltaproteobacteria bacterium]|nr:O-antigen ligase family protein [Deltaproteobacteria bacterium]
MTAVARFAAIPVFLFFFFILTGVHFEMPGLLRFYPEIVLFGASLVGVALVAERSELAMDLWACGLCLAVVPILSSLASGREAELFSQPEYRSWVSCLLMGGPLALVFGQADRRKGLFLLLATVAATVILLFLYHYLVLHEVREFDLRPLLNTKNGDPNFLCTIFGFFIPLLAHWGLEHRWTWAVVIPLFGCAILTQSRMGLIALGLSSVYWVWTLGPRYRFVKTISGGLLFVALGVLLLNPNLRSRFRTIHDTANLERIQTYRNGLKLFSENPILGVGWGHAPDTFFQNGGYPAFQSDHTPLEIHMTPFQIAAELGFVGLLAFGWLIGIVLRSFRQARDPLLLHASVASVLCLGLNSLTLPLATKDFFVVFLFIVAVLNQAT